MMGPRKHTVGYGNAWNELSSTPNCINRPLFLPSENFDARRATWYMKFLQILHEVFGFAGGYCRNSVEERE